MHGECYRRANGQPYTRKEYIKGKPQIKIAKFNSGNKKRKFEYCVQLMINVYSKAIAGIHIYSFVAFMTLS